jgi:hypothetical protein
MISKWASTGCFLMQVGVMSCGDADIAMVKGAALSSTFALCGLLNRISEFC